MTVQARSLAFASLVASFFAIIVTNRCWSHHFHAILRMPNAAQWWVVARMIGLLALALSLPVACGLFHFSPVHGLDLAVAIAAGAASIAWFEAFKLRRRHRARIPRLSARSNPSFRDCAPRSS